MKSRESANPEVLVRSSGPWHTFWGKVAATLTTRGLLLFVTLASSIVSARYLGPEGRGVYAVLMSIAAIGVQFGNVGLHAANTYFLGQDRSLRSRIVYNSASVSLLLGGVIILGLSVLRGLIWTPGGYPLWMYYVAVAGIPFSLFYLFAVNIRLGLGQIGSFNRTEIIVNVSGLVAVVVLLAALRLDAGSLIVYSTVFNACAAVWLFLQLMRSAEPEKFDMALFSRMFRYGLKAYTAAIFAFLVLRFDLLMVNRMIGVEAAGIYSMAVQIADVLYLFPVSIGLVLFPEIAGMKSGTLAFAKSTARVTAMLLGVGAVGVWFVAPLFIQIAYGTEFIEAATALKWLLPGIWILGINTVFMNYFAGTGMPLITVISPAIALLMNVGLNLILIPRMGISGAALASTVAYFLMFGCSMAYLFWTRTSAE